MRNRNSRPLIAAAAAILVSGALAMPAVAGPVSNDNELLLSGGFFHADDSDFSNLNVDLSWGRYLANPALQVGLMQTLNWLIVDDAEDPWSATTAPFFNYHFMGMSPENTVVPFIGGFGGVVWNDDDVTGTIGPAGGLKFFVTDHTFIQTKYRYEWFFDDLDQTDDQADDGNHIVSLGIGYVWGGSGTR